MPVETHKQCRKCRLSKPLSDFPKRTGFKSLLAGWCTKCRNHRFHGRAKRLNPEGLREKNRRNSLSYLRRKQVADPLVTRRSHLKKRFGITIEAFDALLEQQGGVCAICGSTHNERVFERLAVDHDHETGEVHGILCRKCNSALGMFQDDPDLLRKAAEYLEKAKVILSP